MHLKSRLFITILISFLLLTFSLYLGYRSISHSGLLITKIEKEQLRLAKLASNLNIEVEKNQSNILQTIILKETHLVSSIQNSFDSIHKLIDSLDAFIALSFINDEEIKNTMQIIKTRVVGYKSVEMSIIAAIHSEDQEDFEDALLGFNSITVRLSDDINQLIKLSEKAFSLKLHELQLQNEDTQKIVFLAFVVALLLIVFSIYKMVNLHNELYRQVNRAQDAEEHQKHLQEQLLRYNEELESEIAKKTQELHERVYSHFLSGLPNRNRLIEDSQSYAFKQMALLNIDRFQKFNDIYGEEVGNVALKMSADFLKEQIEYTGMLLYHIGSDEFVVASYTGMKQSNAYFIEQIENLLTNYQRENFIYEDQVFNFMMSAGIAFNGNKKMLAYADMALKDAKKRKSHLSVFHEDKSLEKKTQDDIEYLQIFTNALKDSSLCSFFQPITPLANGSLETKYESLARIVMPDGRVIAPIHFIDVAKANRIYHKLTKRIFENSFDVIRKFKIHLSINISMEDIDNDKTLKMIYNFLNDFEYNEYLTFELLETEDMADYKKVYEFCLKIKSYGIKIALDDFGSGYSNFSHVLNLPIDFIKIDSSLISNIDRDEHSRIMVQTIVGLAKKLNIQTIAEYVSTKEIYETVKALDVDYAQGYFLGKPDYIERHLEITLID